MDSELQDPEIILFVWRTPTFLFSKCQYGVTRIFRIACLHPLHARFTSHSKKIPRTDVCVGRRQEA
jgi:hypothetical protein